MVLRALVIGFVLVASGCGDGGNKTTSSRCEDVPQELADAIQTGLTMQGGGSLRNAEAVESHDFEARVWFVSAEIDASGSKGDGKVATWAKVGALAADDEMQILSVDSLAQEVSDWGIGGVTDAQLSMEDDGARESDACVHNE